MKNLFLLLTLFLLGCQGDKREPVNDEVPIEAKPDTITNRDHEPAETTNTSANERFRNVRVEPIGDNAFKVTGEGQIFEAAFGWVVEDGHDELEKGFEMTDRGAPEWGNFSFTVKAEKFRENSTLHLILFETSAKDGSRQHELPIKLY